jgi:hypothetical protein
LDDGTVYAVEFKQDVPTPRKITPTQLEDWLERVARSGLIPRSMSLDVGVDDSSLDNFKIDPDGSLRYIDGDFATFIKASDEQLQESLKEQRSQLQPYVRDLGQVGLENPLYFTDEHATILESMGPNRPVIADQPSPSNVSSLQDPKKDWWTV